MDGWLLVLPVVSLPQLIGEMLEEVVRRKSASVSSLDGWESSRFCLLRGLMALLVIISKVEEVGVWPEGLLDAYIALVPKAVMPILLDSVH